MRHSHHTCNMKSGKQGAQTSFSLYLKKKYPVSRCLPLFPDSSIFPGTLRSILSRSHA